MKPKLILGSLLATSVMATAQTPWLVSGGGYIHNNPTSSYVGIGTTTPADLLHISQAATDRGITITNTSNNSAQLKFRTSGAGAGHFIIGGTGSANPEGNGCFVIHDGNTSISRFLINPSGNVGIGTISPTNARLEIRENANTQTVNRGFYSDATNTTWTSGTQGAISGISIGAHGRAGAPAFVQQLSDNIGVYGEAYEGSAMGGFFYGGSSGGTTTYGVYARASNPGGTGAWAGFFDGSVNAMGGVYSNYVLLTSDRKLKKDIKPLTNSLSKLMLLKPSTYNFRTDEFKSMSLPEEKQMGLIAQELAEVFPELVGEVAASKKFDPEAKTNEMIPEHKAVNYIGLIPVLISGIQEQQQTIEDLKNVTAEQQKQLNEQKQLIETLTQKVSGTTGIGSVNIETGFQMSQNEPNPFTHETVVKYSLPQTVSNAFMAVYDLTGKQITTFPVDQKAFSITLTSEKLAAGIYIYSIVADGKVMDSKRMIVAEK